MKGTIVLIWCLWPQSFEGSGSWLPPGTLSGMCGTGLDSLAMGVGPVSLSSPFASSFHVLQTRELTTRCMATRCLTPVRSVATRLHMNNEHHRSGTACRTPQYCSLDIGRMDDVSIILRAPVSRLTASATLFQTQSSSLQAALSAMTSGTGYCSINAKLCGS